MRNCSGCFFKLAGFEVVVALEAVIALNVTLVSGVVKFVIHVVAFGCCLWFGGKSA